MSCLFILIAIASVLLVVLGYWRAFVLHRRIREIDPQCPWQRTDFMTPRKPRKD